MGLHHDIAVALLQDSLILFDFRSPQHQMACSQAQIMRACTRARAHTHTHTCMPARTNMHTMHTHMCTHAHVCIEVDTGRPCGRRSGHFTATVMSHCASLQLSRSRSVFQAAAFPCILTSNLPAGSDLSLSLSARQRCCMLGTAALRRQCAVQ